MTTPVDFATEYSEFASRLSLEDLSGDTIQAAKTNVFDTLACAIAGFSANGIKDLTALVTEWRGKPEATIWSAGIKVPAPQAAWVNGAVSHARDYDDTHDGAVLHAGVSVVPAALAAAELSEASGADLLAGIVVGLELACRLGTAARIGLSESGFMYTALLGTFAATAAAARVCRLDARLTAHALGIALSQASGTTQASRDAALTKRIQPGFSARTGLFSVAMAMRGITGAVNTFEGGGGLFNSYLRGRYEPQVLRQGLGRDYEFVNLGYKFYPCCRNTHTSIDAALAVRERLAGDTNSIQEITVGVNQEAYEAVCLPLDLRRRPTTVVQAQFSIPYTVACALVKGRVALEDLTDAALKDAKVLELADRVMTYVDQDILRRSAGSISPAILTVKGHHGVHTSTVEIPRGHPSQPLSPVHFDEKLQSCIRISGREWPAHFTENMRNLINRLEDLPQGADLVRIFATTTE